MSFDAPAHERGRCTRACKNLIDELVHKKEGSPKEREWHEIGDAALPDVIDRAVLRQRLANEKNETLREVTAGAKVVLDESDDALAKEKAWQEGAERERMEQEQEDAAEKLYQSKLQEEWDNQVRAKEALLYISRPRDANRYRFVHDFLKNNIVSKLANVSTDGSPHHRLACMSLRARLIKEALDLGLFSPDDDDVANKVTALYKTYFAEPAFWYVFDISLQGLPLPYSITFT